MTTSKLSRLLLLFEGSSSAISVRELARELDISQGQVESMMEYWISKGRIKISTSQDECGNCSAVGECPFILEMPRTYELVKEGAEDIVEVIQPACK